MSSEYLTRLKNQRDRDVNELSKRREELEEDGEWTGPYSRDRDECLKHEIRQTEAEYDEKRAAWFEVFDEIFCRKCDVLTIDDIERLADLRMELLESFE